MERGLAERWVSGLAGITLLAAALPSAVVVLFLALLVRSPDALEPDGDPCCPRPDTWVATAGWAVVVLVAAAVVGLLAAAAAGLLKRAATGRGVPARGLVRGPSWAAVAVSLVMALSTAASLVH